MSLVVTRMSLYFEKQMFYNTLGKLTKAFKSKTPNKHIQHETRPTSLDAFFVFRKGTIWNRQSFAHRVSEKLAHMMDVQRYQR
jgi:hypothetical protein